MTFCYDTLPSNASFRIFILEPGDIGHSLQGSLKTYSRDNAPPYEALSYVWGSPHRTQSMECNGQNFPITESLNAALRHIRSSYSPRLFWIDQICINQSDLDERRQQVTIMREIYANAEMVTAWLGVKGAEQAESVAEVIFQMARNRRLIVYNGPQGFPEDGYLVKRDLPVRTSPIWVAFNDMLHLPYFKRIWIIQEIAVSSQFQLLWGNVTIPGPEFRAARDWALMHGMHIVEPKIHDPRPSLALGRTVVTFDSPKRRPSDWLGLITRTRGHEATDGRDRVYALMGLVDEPSYNIIPDYTKTEAEVFRDFTLQVISKSNSLAILSHCCMERLEAAKHPFWVPRWTLSKGEFPRSLHYHKFDASKGFDVSLNDANTIPEILAVSGFQVDVVMGAGASMAPEGDAFPITEAMQLISKHQKVFAEKNGSNPIKPLLLSMIASRGRNTIGDGPGKLIDNDYLNSFLAYSQRAFAEFLEDEYFEDAQTLLGLMNLAFEASPSATHEEPLYQSEATHEWFTSVVTALFEDSPGLIPSCVRMFKTIGKGIGDGRDFVECFLNAALHRKFFITKKGFIGIGPPTMEVGDNVAILFGGSTPYVLRSLPTLNEYAFLGECYLHGMMEGEAIEMFKRNEMTEMCFLLR